MPSHRSLTDIAVKKFPVPDQGTVTHWDKATDGLGMRISAGGAKTFIVLTGSGRRQKIGRYPTISLSEARTEAKRIKAELTLGRYRPPSVAFKTATENYLEACRAKNRPRTVSDYARLLKHFPFGTRKLGDIRKHHITERLNCITASSEAAHARVAIKVFFSWCVKQGYIQSSPCEGIGGAQRVFERKRVLSTAELQTVLKTAISGSDTFSYIVQLLILTGQRRGEIAALEWSWINRQDRTITLPATITKNKREHTFPYGDMVAEVIEAVPVLNDTYLFPATRDHVRGKPTTVFNGWGKAKAAFDAQLQNVEPWTLHSLRRTLSTQMAAIDVDQIAVEKLLNHVSGGTQSPIAQVYNQHSYIEEMREAVHAYENHLRSLCSRD